MISRCPSFSEIVRNSSIPGPFSHQPFSVSVLGLMNDHEKKVQLLIDEDVLKDPYFGCHPCINTSSLKLYTKDILEKFLPAVHHEYTIVNLPWEE